MSPVQIALMDETQCGAKAASDSATPCVLAALDEPDFRQGLSRCCPQLAVLPALALLEAYRAGTRVSEMTHGFDVDVHG